MVTLSCRARSRSSRRQEAGGLARDRGGVKVTFCSDYQRNRCQRTDCRFVHRSISVETEYQLTGRLPLHRVSVLHSAIPS